MVTVNIERDSKAWAVLNAQLTQASLELAQLRIRRDELIRSHSGTLREIGAAAGLSPQAVLNIRNRKEDTK